MLLARKRRLRDEAQTLANEMAVAINKALGQTMAPLSGRRGPAPVHDPHERVHADQLLGEMGITIQ